MSTYDPLWLPKKPPTPPTPPTPTSKSGSWDYPDWNPILFLLYVPYFLFIRWPYNIIRECLDIVSDKHPKDGSATRLPYYGSNHNGSPW